MFFEKRVYQGSSGVVYPHPIIDKLYDEKTGEPYTALFLENEYLKIMVLPELGGRIQRAYDKVRQRDFIYYNRVIKPALVGLTGPWISGGIEFNWPQHHRPSTFEPVDFRIQENPDGSRTIWVNETEIMFRTKGMAAFTLYPGKAYLEVAGTVFNRTPFPQSFLWWANPAVKVGEAYQSIFPPDVHAVFDHGKRDVSDFPIATGTYYKVNYAPGTDISRYVNIPVPTSYMAIRSAYDFMGGYEHDTGAGMLHIADHHISPGKKQWTWGSGDFGKAWDRNLTDEDGPYIELMTGVYTDNQPDFSWLQPNESKRFEQYFMPYAGLGQVMNATKEAALHVAWQSGKLSIKVCVTSVYDSAVIHIMRNGMLLREDISTLAPDNIYVAEVEAPEPAMPDSWSVTISDTGGRDLVSYRFPADEKAEMPVAASAAKSPAEIGQVEELYLTGLHLEQYRHPTFDPADYYLEGLSRSPGDTRCNNAMGLLLLRRGQFEKSESFFRRAIATLTARNPNPYDGEPFYNLGLSLLWQGRYDAAYDAFYKATWNDAWQHSGFLALARLACRKGQTGQALAFAVKSVVRNADSPAALHLKALLLRLSGRVEECLAVIGESLSTDPFNFGCMFEKYLVTTLPSALAEWKDLMRNALNNYLELSLDYAQAGRYEEAGQVLRLYIEDMVPASPPSASPLVYYYLGWFALLSGRKDEALEWFGQAARLNPDRCFPNKTEEILILQSALALNPGDARAHHYLGNLWYDKRQYDEAIACWEASIRLDDRYPTAFRNLALACYNQRNDPDTALTCLERAFQLDAGDGRILMELDQLYKLTGRSCMERLRMLESHPMAVEERDDLYLERITLYNSLGKYAVARELLAARHFHPWEGGEGKVVAQYLLSHLGLARQSIGAGDWQEALEWLRAAGSYPHNLGEGRLHGTPDNDRCYWLGCAYEGMGQPAQALQRFMEATNGPAGVVMAIYYNDPPPDRILYQALAWDKLGHPGKAREILDGLIEFGRQHMNDEVNPDYFAVSLPDMLVFDRDLSRDNRIHCIYLMGLGYLGLREYQRARDCLEEVLRLDINHQGAAIHLQMIH
jgi:tetratricopeptide (TPR) repeat protein